ncbi:MAG: RND transporter, partial [Burkholderiales bacterium]
MRRTGITVIVLAALTLQAVPAAAQDIATEGIAPSRWQPALPHAGQKARLLRWWAQWNDPVLLSLIESAQTAQADLPRS